jgi:hypothetical protein
VIDPRFAILGALITVAGSASYARDTLRGRTQPNRVTWLLWTLAPLIAFAAEVVQHVGLQALMTLAVGLGPLLVVIASYLDPRAYWQLTRLDIGCGCLSLAALAAWGVTGTGDIAILFSILSDLFGGIPTLRKAYQHPATESASAFAASGCGATLTLLTIPASAWSFATAGFPLYILAADLTLATLILFPRRRGLAATEEPDRGATAAPTE